MLLTSRFCFGLFSLLLVTALGRSSLAGDGRPAPMGWGDKAWLLHIDPTTGALIRIENRTDPHHMDWLREAGRWDHRNWLADASPAAITQDGQWGLVETAQTGLLHVAQVQRISDSVWESTYTSAALTVVARRE